jgi:hypothetical protein
MYSKLEVFSVSAKHTMYSRERGTPPQLSFNHRSIERRKVLTWNIVCTHKDPVSRDSQWK